MLVFTLHLKVDAKLTTVNEITRNLFVKKSKRSMKMLSVLDLPRFQTIEKDGVLRKSLTL